MRPFAALAVTTIAACGSSSAPPATCGDFQALLAASDYSSSGVGAIGVDGAVTMRIAVDLGTDPALATSGGRTFFVDRLGDAIFEIDPRCGTPSTKWSTSDARRRGTTNPQDVAVAADGALWVPRYNEPSLAILEPRSDVARTIDLSSYDDDGNPNASAIAIPDGSAKAFVALQRLDDTDPMLRSTRPSQMLRVDVAAATVETVITFEGRNPFGQMTPYAGALFVAMPGNFSAKDEYDAGIERFDTAKSTTHLLVRERDLGGSVVEVAVTDGCGAAIVADESTANRTSLVTFDPASGAVLASASKPLLATDGFDLRALAWVTPPGGAPVLLVGDRRPAARGYAVHVFDRTDACTLHVRPDVIFAPAKPIALRAIR